MSSLYDFMPWLKRHDLVKRGESNRCNNTVSTGVEMLLRDGSRACDSCGMDRDDTKHYNIGHLCGDCLAKEFETRREDENEEQIIRMFNWQESRIVCIDTETTSLNPAVSQIVQFCMVLLDMRNGTEDLKPQVLINELCNPGQPIPLESQKIHGICDADVAGKQHFGALLPTIITHLGNSVDVIVGYNYPYDASVIDALSGGAWSSAIDTLQIPVIDPLVLVRDVGKNWTGNGRHKLDNVRQRLEIKEEKAHDAYGDCMTTLRVLWKLRKSLPMDAHEAARQITKWRTAQDAAMKHWRDRRA